jgi:fructoselysine 6-phosphate deglycase
MAHPFDRSKFIGDLEGARSELHSAADLGASLGKKPYKRMYLVACGAPNGALSVIEYWTQKISKSLEIRRYFPATLLHQDPPSLDEDTMVILGSHSGSTTETVQAAKYLQKQSSPTLSITQDPTSPLARNSDFVLTYGPGNQGYYAALMLFLSFVSAFLEEKEDWVLNKEVLTSLKSFPECLAETFESEDINAGEVANRLKDKAILYIVGAGPVFCTAYVIANCILMEMQRLHAHPLEAAEFFHGPFEVIDAKSTLILLLGEDPSRPEAQRVANFCKTHAPQTILYDSLSYPMNGIEDEIRPILAPFILDAALYRVAEHLASLRNHPLTLRRYMGKVEY